MVQRKSVDTAILERLDASTPGAVSMDILDQLEKDCQKLYMFGGLEVQSKASADSKDMRMAGFVSTPRIDLANEVIDVDSFEKYFPYYQRNPIYCYNHDKSIPVGRVNNPYIVKTGVKTGLYLDEIKLTALPFVVDIMWPLIVDKVIQQQSIGFYSLKGGMDGSVYHHKEVYTLEGSAVPIACNPDATLDEIKNWLNIKGFAEGGTVMDLIAAYAQGKAHKIPQFLVGALPLGVSTEGAQTDNTTTVGDPKTMAKKLATDSPVTPDFTDVTVIKGDVAFLDPEGEVVSKPHRYMKHFDEVCQRVYAAKSETHQSYLFPIAVPTLKGYRYDFEQAATSMYKLLGGGGGVHMNPEVKSAVIERVAEAYHALEKRVPTVNFDLDGVPTDVPVNDLAAEHLSQVDLKEINFHEQEQSTFGLAVFRNDADKIKRMLEHWSKNGGVPEAAKEVCKALYGSVDIYMWAPLRDADALKFITSVVNQIQEHMTALMTDESPLLWSAPDGETKEPNYRLMADHFAKLADEQDARKAAATTTPPAEGVKSAGLSPEDAQRMADEFNAVISRVR